MLSPTTLEERLFKIQKRIKKTATRSGRKPKNITIVAATKAFPIEAWKHALNANLTTFGESRIQEAQKKVEMFNKIDKIELHLIGHLQTNKVRKAIKYFDVIQTVDSIRLADKINRICQETNKKQKIFLQVNTGEDTKKHGISVKKTTDVAHKISKMENLNLLGVMTIPPYGLSQKETGFVYRKTREIRDKIYLNINDCCQNISMGMSSDYEIAITEGATHIRIGNGLFGYRPK